jgi:hypothetical protein
MKNKMALSLGAFCLLMGMTNVSNAAACTAANSLISVTDTNPAGLYEYVIFTIKSPLTATYSVNSATPPFEHDASGDVVPVAGVKFKKIQFRNIAWMCSSSEVFSLPNTQIKDVKNAGNFEGVITYIVGYQSSPKYLMTYQYAAGSNTKVVMKFKK